MEGQINTQTGSVPIRCESCGAVGARFGVSGRATFEPLPEAKTEIAAQDVPAQEVRVVQSFNLDGVALTCDTCGHFLL
jgi:uncharacterized Zn finger protein